jgi:hypothetical protein
MHFIVNSYIYIYENLCDYKFYVFQFQDIWIQQLLCFHICQFGFFNKLENV